MPTAPHPAAKPLRQRLVDILAALEAGLVERRDAVRAVLVTALAGEHVLLIGPPGTAKSELARRLHRAFGDTPYFERLLTRFTVPEELFGPLSISALENDRYERQTAGFLPQAGVAFIDEVFKANSAILNALLTLLNEREFDNGPRREPCPLITVIGATNAVPEDEIGEAFFDRFLARVPVASVSAAGFGALVTSAAPASAGPAPSLEAGDLDRLRDAAVAVSLGADALRLLADLRAHLEAGGAYVSDRRWVKIVHLMKTAAATEGRAMVEAWDLWLAPACVAAGREAQEAVTDWLCARMGVREAVAPARMSGVLAAFEAQAEIERHADDLDYDDNGRLRFSAGFEGEVSDAKGAAQAPRISYRRSRRYGTAHIEARTRQIDELRARIAGYRAELDATRDQLARWRGLNLWICDSLAARADANLARTGLALEDADRRAVAARAAFEALPRLAGEAGPVPAPVTHEPLPA